MKEDEYDKDDGFVDDSELLWEEQAAAANDGFFVYSGPLVPEGEKPALDVRYVHYYETPIFSMELTVIAELMALRSVAEDVEVVVELVLPVVVEALQLWLLLLACDQTAFHFQDLVRGVDLPLENHASPRQIVLEWSRRSLTERRWVRWPRCPATMEAV
jgi:hypothetical protein